MHRTLLSAVLSLTDLSVSFSFSLQSHELARTQKRFCANKGATIIPQLWQASIHTGGLGLIVILFALVCVHPTQAATFTCGDVGCLIAAINTANMNGEDDTINLVAGTYILTAVNNNDGQGGVNGLPRITSNISVIGVGADTTIIERDESAPFFRLFFIETGTLLLEGLTIKGGAGQIAGGGIRNIGGTLVVTNSSIVENSAEQDGGGLFFDSDGTITNSTVAYNSASGFCGGGITLSAGTITIANSTITNNSAVCGGGIRVVGGTAIIMNSTIANNSAIRSGGLFGNGGGLFIAGGGTAIITNSTIVHNFVSDSGGGLRNSNDSPVELQNTILAENTGVGGPDDCLVALGTVTSLGNNLIGYPSNCSITLVSTDLIGSPGLGPFMDDGTPGNGHFPLLSTSRAINAGNDAACPPTDQLDQRRVGRCDIGAIEFQGAPDTTPPIITVSVNPATLWPPNGRRVTVTVSGTITDEDGGSGVNVGSTAYVVMDEYGQVQPKGTVTLMLNGSYSFPISLQASRNENDLDGRHYTIAVSAKDNAGKLGVKSTIVTVPHDQGQQAESGVLYGGR